MRNGILALSLFALTGSDAFAAEVSGVRIADKVSVDGQELVLNGAGMRTRLFIKVYVGALYLPAKTGSAQEALGNRPRRMQLVLQRELSADTLLEALRTGLSDNNSQAELDAIRTQTDQFLTIFRTVGEAKAGQVIALDYTPAAGLRVSLDEVVKGTIAGEPFARALFKTWLGEKPVQESLKKALLGAG